MAMEGNNFRKKGFEDKSGKYHEKRQQPVQDQSISWASKRTEICCFVRFVM